MHYNAFETHLKLTFTKSLKPFYIDKKSINASGIKKANVFPGAYLENPVKRLRRKFSWN